MANIEEQPLVLSPETPNGSVQLDELIFRQLRELIYQESGIFLSDNKIKLLENRLRPLLAELQVPDYEALLEQCKSDPTRRVLNCLLDAVVISETSFFRNEPQWRAFVQTVFPEALENARNAGRQKLRILSAGCSTGEEPYTLAILLKKHFTTEISRNPVELLGVDISEKVLSEAQKAQYPEFSLRNLDDQILHQYFQKQGYMYQLNEDIRAMVKFQRANLLNRPQMLALGHFDIIFCRNVLLYFPREAKIQAVSTLHDMLYPHGYLFVGYSESLHGISRAFQLVLFPKAIGYKKELVES